MIANAAVCVTGMVASAEHIVCNSIWVVLQAVFVAPGQHINFLKEVWRTSSRCECSPSADSKGCELCVELSAELCVIGVVVDSLVGRGRGQLEDRNIVDRRISIIARMVIYFRYKDFFTAGVIVTGIVPIDNIMGTDYDLMHAAGYTFDRRAAGEGESKSNKLRTKKNVAIERTVSSSKDYIWLD